MKFPQKAKTKNKKQTNETKTMHTFKLTPDILLSHDILYRRISCYFLTKGQSWYEHTKTVLLIKYNNSHEARHTSLFNVLLGFWT